MEFSDELVLFLGQLHQDFHMEGDTLEAFTNILIGLGRARSQKLASFLDAFLARTHDMQDLERQWSRSGAEFWLKDVERIPLFLAAVRDLAKSPRVTSSAIP